MAVPPMTTEQLLPSLPECTDPAGTVGNAFEWYKHTALLAATAMRIHPQSSALRELAAEKDAVLRGLLNRCARLMLGTLRLTSTAKHGEAAMILARCINESAVVGRWLIIKERDGSFRKYFADALRTELELRRMVEAAVDERGGAQWPIEARMLAFVEKLLLLAGLTPFDVKSAGRLPTFRTMATEVGLGELAYVFLHRLGSQSVHGTWSDLVDHYLLTTTSPSSFSVRDNDVRPQVPLFVLPALQVNQFVYAYARYRAVPCRERKSFLLRSRLVHRRLLATARAEDPDDYAPAHANDA
jgi:hypothetical protein